LLASSRVLVVKMGTHGTPSSLVVILITSGGRVLLLGLVVDLSCRAKLLVASGNGAVDRDTFVGVPSARVSDGIGELARMLYGEQWPD